MKCRICGKKAIIELRAHNIALCKDDFNTFFERRIKKTISHFRLIDRDEKVAVAVSGGKDSLSLLYALNRFGLSLSGVYINLGIERYSDLSEEKCKRFSQTHGIPIYSFSTKDFFGKDIHNLSSLLRRPPCSICGTVKRYIMNRFCIEYGFHILATGHNLDDEAATLLGNLITFNTNYLGKENLCLPPKLKTVKKIKPLGLISEREIAAYALTNSIDYIYDECPYSLGATSLKYKEALNLIEEKSPGSKLNLFKRYIENADIFKRTKKEIEDRLCKNCGFLTTQEVCSFCSTLIRLGIPNSISNFSNYFKKL